MRVFGPPPRHEADSLNDRVGVAAGFGAGLVGIRFLIRGAIRFGVGRRIARLGRIGAGEVHGGVGFIVLMGPTSRSVDFSPQGLLEKVLTPSVVHSQICPLGAEDWDAFCACSADCCAVGSRSGLCAAAAVGAAGAAAGDAEAACETGGGVDCTATIGSGRRGDAVRLDDTAVMATATAVADRAPNIQGSKSRSLFMGPSSSAAQRIEMNIRQLSGAIDREMD